MNIFFEQDYFEFDRNRRLSLVKELKSKDDEYILNVDENDYKQYLFERFKLEPLIISKEPINISKPEKVFKESDGPFGYGKFEVYKFNLEYKVEGSFELIHVKPQTYAMVTEDVQTNSGNVIVTFYINSANEEEFNKSKVTTWGRAFANVESLNKDVNNWNDQLPSFIDNEFSKYKQKVLKENQFYVAIKIKIDPDTKGVFTVPTITRKEIPQPVINKERSYSLDPTVSQAIYDDVLMVINQIGKNIEKKPSVYTGKDEEALRDYFLPILETRYISTTVTGETFNKSGKTDVLIKYEDGSNLFVAEFKIWSGEKAFYDAINQLFDRYLTNRDSKTALIIFVRNKEFTEIVRKVKQSVINHMYFSKKLVEKDDSAIRLEMNLPTDNEKKILLEILLFSIPE